MHDADDITASALRRLDAAVQAGRERLASAHLPAAPCADLDAQLRLMEAEMTRLRSDRAASIASALLRG